MKKKTTSFDKKFGKEFLASLPKTPGVYLVFNESDRIIYVGKAKNLRRRLNQYRNAKRRKKHEKMRTIVSKAARIEYRVCETDLEACLLETKLIQEHRPRWNVAGAFSFMYPMIGMRFQAGLAQFAYTTKPELFPEDYAFFGAFRSRQLTGDGFFALMKLLQFVGHRNQRKRREAEPKYSYVFEFRGLPEDWFGLWSGFWSGKSKDAVESLVLSLVENAGARRKPDEIQELLNAIGRFWRHEAAPLEKAIRRTDFQAYPVPQTERDLLFLRYRHQVSGQTKGPAARAEALR